MPHAIYPIELADKADADEVLCPDCEKPLRPIWHGLLACFCTWGGRQPAADEIVQAADAEQRPFH